MQNISRHIKFNDSVSHLRGSKINVTIKRRRRDPYMFLVSLSIGLIVSGKDCGNDGWPLVDQYAQVPELFNK